MHYYARTAANKRYEIIPINRPFSFFDFVERNFSGLASLRRTLSQVRLLGGKTMVMEEIDKANDLDEEDNDIRKRYPNFNKSTTFRLSFFTKGFSTKRGLSTAGNGEFIGYAIVKSDDLPSQGKRPRIYESVIKPSQRPNNYVHGAQNWSCCVMGNKFEVSGYLYAQQNDNTNVCAHVAIRTVVARYHKNGDMSYREMNNLVGIDHVKRKVGGADGGGLNTREMVKILEAAGARCFMGDYLTINGAPAPFQKYLYGSIESGFPAIVCFKTTEDDFHAIPIFGHTFNEDTWVPNAEFSYFRVGSGTRYIPSESWLSMFIAHDDNWGSNFCIPRRYLQPKRICKEPGKAPELCRMEQGGVAYVISTVPKEIKMSPIRAEVIGADYLFTILPQMPSVQEIWGERLKYYTERDMLILRPIIASGNSYANHLKEARDWNGNPINPGMIKVLKNHFANRLYWLIELSLPELFSSNRRKVGEVLIRADIEPGVERDFESFVMARLPGHFAIYDGGGSSNPRYKFFPSGAEGHIELYGRTL